MSVTLADLPGAKEAIAGVTPKLFINGQFCDAISGKQFDVICPINEELIVKVAEADAADIDRAVAAAQAAFEDGPWGKMTQREKGRLLYKLADLMEEHAEELAILESVDNGKSLMIAKMVDIPMSVSHFRYMAGWADKLHGETIPTGDGSLAHTLLEPVGVVGAITPWNFPLLMSAWKLAPALAAGCTVVLKVSEVTPLTTLKLAELSVKAGFPPGVINVVPGYGATAGAALCNHPDVHKLSFTGSSVVGKLVMKAAADQVKNVSLELGGKSPLIVCSDADVEKAAQVAHFGQFFNHSQCCCASTRIYCHESIYDAFVKRSVELASAIKVGNPFDMSTNQGPQVNKAHIDKFMKYVALGREQGATLLCGGEKEEGKGYFAKPTIFGDVADSMAICTDEIFAPIMSVIKFTDLDDVIKRANDSPYGLAAGLISQNVDTINKVTRKLRAGTVWVNCWNVLDDSLPFGGYKQSGVHRDKGRDAINNYLETKAVVVAAP